MFQQNYNPYQQQFGGYPQPQMIEPPMPTNRNAKNGGSFWVGFGMGIVTAIIVFVGIEVYKRMKQTVTPDHKPLPNSEDKPTMGQKLSKSIHDAITPVEKQTFDEFLDFIEENGFHKNEALSENTANSVWCDNTGNEIHFGSFDFTVKHFEGKQISFSKKDALFLAFNQNLLNFLNNEN